MDKKLRTKEVKTFIEEWVCLCGGLMQDTGEPLLLDSAMPKTLHRCDTCKNNEYSEDTYPRARIEYVEEE